MSANRASKLARAMLGREFKALFFRVRARRRKGKCEVVVSRKPGVHADSKGPELVVGSGSSYTSALARAGAHVFSRVGGKT